MIQLPEKQYMKRIKHWIYILFRLILIAMLCWLCFMLGGLWESIGAEEPYRNHTVMAEHALKNTNLPKEFADNYVLHGSHMGRDMYSQTIFCISGARQEQLMECILKTDGWTAETITAADYRDFADVTWYPTLVKNTVADDIVFDAWFYRETTPSVGYEPLLKGHFSFLGRAARGFEFAVYDKDTGLFIFIEQHG